MHLAASWSITLFLASYSLAQSQALSPRPLWHSDFEEKRLIDASDLICVGQILREETISVHLDRDDIGNQGEWNFTRSGVHIDTCLKGAVSERASFYSYRWNGGTVGAMARFKSGSRYIFFLVLRDGLIRSTRDGAPSAIELWSKNQGSLSLGSTIEERIATLLLTPDPSIAGKSLQHSLNSSAAIAFRLIGTCRTFVALKNLMSGESAALQEAAREVLSRYRRYVTECDVGRVS